MKHMIERMQYQYLTAHGMEFPNSLEGDLLKTCYEIFLKQKPPTFDEVVKAWEKVNKDLNVYIHNDEFCVTDIDEDETSVFWYDTKTGGYEFKCVSMEMIYTINLTIRYLEATKNSCY